MFAIVHHSSYASVHHFLSHSLVYSILISLQHSFSHSSIYSILLYFPSCSLFRQLNIFYSASFAIMHHSSHASVHHFLSHSSKIVSEYDQEIPRQAYVTARKSHTTISRHQEDKSSKAISSLFPIKMIAKLEWT